MHPVLNDGHTYWHTLSGKVFIFVLFLSLWHCSVSSLESQYVFQSHLGLSLNENSEGIPYCYKEESSLVSEKNSVSCDDLEGVGSLNSSCTLYSDLQLDGDLCISGAGNLEVSADVTIQCLIKGCSLTINVTGNVKLGPYATIVAGSVAIEAASINLEHHSSINTTSLGGPPPAQTSGTPSTYDGAGGGHGGRGASCLKNNQTNWGGDGYAWSTLSDPWSYGSKGGSTSADMKYGGCGGGRIMLKVNDILYVNGSVIAEGGEGGLKGGGGSGGSIKIHALKLKGDGIISAAGGRGWGGGGGGRISLECYSIKDVFISVHGGQSVGCPANAGAAGTIFDKTLQSLKVSNANFTTETETPLLDFPTRMLWSNVYVESNARVLVPLLWTRVQVRGQIRLLYGGHISFGLSGYPFSEFELVAEELLISNSVIKVYGAFRMYVKMLLMWDSKIQIDGGENTDIGPSLLEARNLVVLRQNSVICSNAELGVYGQGLLMLSGHGDAIKGQRLYLSLFYKIAQMTISGLKHNIRFSGLSIGDLEVGHGSLLQAPLDDENGRNLATQSRCESSLCPLELITPPDDCHVNNSMSFTLQIRSAYFISNHLIVTWWYTMICRVEDLSINGSIRASILHIHRARTVIINHEGMISASELGCKEGIGMGRSLSYGAGGGAGHGGKGGSGFFNGTLVEGGKKYGDADLPCELGSGSGGSGELLGHAAGGGLIVIGSTKWPLSTLEVYGSLKADGETHVESKRNRDGSFMGGLGGGSGGTVLLFLQRLMAGNNSSVSIAGGNGGPIGGGGGGGGRVHFDWSNIATGGEYVQIATINGTINASGGAGRDGGYSGESGTITGKACPKGLYGTFCNECPIGTYKDLIGTDPSLCAACSPDFVPNRASFTYVRGGATLSSCPYKCSSERYKMPKCYTPFEELVFTFGGPWPFGLLLLFSLVLSACLLSALRIKLLGSEFSYQAVNSVETHGSHSFPYLLSLAEVQGTSRAEETQSHVYRMYFMGPNTFREPWHLPYSPPEEIIGIVYEDVFNRFIDEINSIAAYEWWEGSVHSILSVIAYPCAWSWKQWRRRKKIDRLREYVKSEYDHACLRSCRSRALYKGMKVGSTPDLMVAFIDFFLGGDEKRVVVASTELQRFPLCAIFGGDGSFMSPYYLHNDILLTNLISQYVPADVWNRFAAGLNAQLRTVRDGTIHSGLGPVITWISTHGNSQLEPNCVKVDLGWFQATASGYYQLGVIVGVNGHFARGIHQLDVSESASPERSRGYPIVKKSLKQSLQNQPSIGHVNSRKRMTGGVSGGMINEATLQSLDYRRRFLFPFSFLLQNTRPIGLQETIQLLMAFMLLGDFVITGLTLLQFYWMSLAIFLVVLLVLPLSLFSPFPAGLHALFSQGPRRSSLARIYALWNITSLSNILVAFVCGISYDVFSASGLPTKDDPWHDNEWWILPAVLFVIKMLQAGLINFHIANLEIEDYSLFNQDPQRFWAS